MDQKVVATNKEAFMAKYEQAFGQQEEDGKPEELWRILEGFATCAASGCMLRLLRVECEKKSSDRYYAAIAKFDRATGSFQAVLQFNHSERITAWFMREGLNPPTLLAALTGHLEAANKLFGSWNLKATSNRNFAQQVKAVKSRQVLIETCPPEVAVVLAIYLIARTRKVSLSTSISRANLLQVLVKTGIAIFESEKKVSQALKTAQDRGDVSSTPDNLESVYLLRHGKQLAESRLSS